MGNFSDGFSLFYKYEDKWQIQAVGLVIVIAFEPFRVYDMVQLEMIY